MKRHGIWHGMTHKHTLATREDFGMFLFCVTRIRGRVHEIWFQPALPGAAAHEVPDYETFEIMLDCRNTLEAMAVLRRAAANELEKR